MAKKIDLKILSSWLDELEKLAVEGDKIFLTPDGEDVLVEILTAEIRLQEIKEAVKIKLAQAALKIDPNFSSIQADKVKVYYREYGAKYYVDESQLDLLPNGLAIPRTTYQVDSKAVDKWIADNDAMPTGIRESGRSKTLSFTLKNNGKTEE